MAFDVVTDRLGRDVSECPKCSRHERGLCRECPARIEGRARWCARCVGLRRLEDSRRFEAENRTTRNARSRERERQPAVRARKRVNARAWRARHPDKVKAQKRRYLLKQSPTYVATQRRHNANPIRQEKKRAHALARYYELHPLRPDPKCRGCEARIEWTPPGRPPVNCDRCVPPSIAARRKRQHPAMEVAA